MTQRDAAPLSKEDIEWVRGYVDSPASPPKLQRLLRMVCDAALRSETVAPEVAWWNHAVATNMIRDGADGVALIKEFTPEAPVCVAVAPVEVWQVWSRTFNLLFDSEAAAQAFVSSQGAATGGGIQTMKREVLRQSER